MAYSEWPRGRWLVAYGGSYHYASTLSECKTFVTALINIRRREVRKAKFAHQISAVIVRIGTSTAYHGMFHGGMMTGRMHWTRVRPLN